MSGLTYVEEYNLILKALSQYSMGCQVADSRVMQTAFADQATIYSVGADGELAGGSVQTFLFDVLDNDLPSSPNLQSGVISVDILGQVASARVDSDNLAGGRFSDFFHLLKIDGSWKTVSKVFHAHV